MEYHVIRTPFCYAKAMLWRNKKECVSHVVLLHSSILGFAYQNSTYVGPVTIEQAAQCPVFIRAACLLPRTDYYVAQGNAKGQVDRCRSLIVHGGGYDCSCYVPSMLWRVHMCCKFIMIGKSQYFGEKQALVSALLHILLEKTLPPFQILWFLRSSISLYFISCLLPLPTFSVDRISVLTRRYVLGVFGSAVYVCWTGILDKHPIQTKQLVDYCGRGGM